MDSVNEAMSGPLVSVIVAASHPGEALPTALASVIDQTWRRIEPIVVAPSQALPAEMDDVLRRHADELRLVDAPAESKPADLFAMGLASARGDYVAWLTSNDRCDPRRIERQLDLIDGADAPLVACSVPSPAQAGGRAWEAPEDPASDLPWALLDGRIDPRTFLVPRDVLEAVQGFASPFEHLFEYELGLRLASRSRLVVDTQPILAHGSVVKPPGRRSEARAEFDLLWRSAVDAICGTEPLSDEVPNGALRRLSRAYAVSRALGVPSAEHYVLDRAVRQSVAAPVTVVDLQDGAAADAAARPNETGPAGATLLCLDDADGSGWVHQLQRAVEAVDSPWVILAGNGSNVSPSTLAAQRLAAVAGEYDACLPICDPVVFDWLADTSLIPGTLFRVSALGATAWSLCSGEPQFWNAFAHAGRIGALPEDPVSMLGTPLVVALIDADWYRTAYPDVRDSGIDPVEHYLSFGWREGRDPNAWFATHWYLEQNPDVSAGDEPALQHFVRQGARAGRRPHPDFDIAWYSRHYLGLEHPSPEALHHFLTTGLAAGARPAAAEAPTGDALAVALVDAAWYLKTYPDVAAAGIDPAEHYLNHGWREGRDPNPWFATQWYLEHNPEVHQNGGSPLQHFVQHGARAGRRPHPDFDIAWYSRQYLGSERPVAEALYHHLTAGAAAGASPAAVEPSSADELVAALVDRDWYRIDNPDVADAGLDPAEHYLKFGWREGRDPNAWFSTRWYLAVNPTLHESGEPPLTHFAREGARAGCRPHPDFDLAWYAQHYLGLDEPRPEALRHFLAVGLAAGTVPAPLLNRPRVRARLAECGCAERTAFLKRLLLLVRDAKPGKPWNEADADLWPLLLANAAPEDRVPVLVLSSKTSDPEQRLARLMGSALPQNECPLYAQTDDTGRIAIADRLREAEATVVLQLPEQITGLRQLAQALHVGRAVMTDETLCDGVLARWLRDAGIPVFASGAEPVAD